MTRINLPLPEWSQPSNPVYWVESTRSVINPRLRQLQLGCLPLLLGVTGFLILTITVITVSSYWYSLEMLFTSIIGFSLLAMLVLQLTAGVALNIATIAFAAPSISGEREQQSWTILRSTALSIREIILGKWAATLMLLRMPLLGLVILRVISLITALLFLAYALLSETTSYWTETDWALIFGQQIWIPATIAGLTVALYYVVQPVLQFFISDALGLVASALTPASAHSIAMGMALRFGTWIIAITLNGAVIVGFIMLVSSWAEPRYASIEFLRGIPEPSDGLVWWVVTGSIALYALTILLSQLGLLSFSLGYAVQRAKRLVM